MKYQFRGLRNFLLGLALLASTVPAPQHATFAQTDPDCMYDGTNNPVCSVEPEYGSVPPPGEHGMTFVDDWREPLDCANNIKVSQSLPGKGTVKLICPGWPEPEATRECPINEVTREPYPRALVTVPVTFTLKDNLDSKRNFGVAPAPAKNSKYYKTPYGVMLAHAALGTVTIEVRGTRLKADGTAKWLGQKVISPTWTFQDRPWRTTTEFKPVQYAMTSTYQYNASSYGLPEKGRGYDYVQKLPANNYDLPAYPVQLATPCKFEYRLIIQKSRPYWTYNVPLPPGGVRTNFAGKWNMKWIPVATAWKGINMKEHGYPNTYEWWNLVRSGGKFKNIEYWDQPDPSQIWIPVLEVQSVLRSQNCGIGGGANCPEAEPETLTAPTGGINGTNAGSLTGGSSSGGGGGIINPPAPPN